MRRYNRKWGRGGIGWVKRRMRKRVSMRLDSREFCGWGSCGRCGGVALGGNWRCSGGYEVLTYGQYVVDICDGIVGANFSDPCHRFGMRRMKVSCVYLVGWSLGGGWIDGGWRWDWLDENDLVEGGKDGLDLVRVDTRSCDWCDRGWMIKRNVLIKLSCGAIANPYWFYLRNQMAIRIYTVVLCRHNMRKRSTAP